MIDRGSINRDWAAGLLNQQIWCWGQDVKRPEGNWLLESGFQRENPPEHRKECSSVYTLAINEQARIVLRGFGVYLGDDNRGGMFIERFGFSPKFSSSARLECPPWSDADLPVFHSPKPDERIHTAILVLHLLDWIRQYEFDIVAKLGIAYRRETLAKWNNGKRLFIPAEQLASSWRKLSLAFAANTHTWIPIRANTELAVSIHQDAGDE